MVLQHVMFGYQTFYDRRYNLNNGNETLSAATELSQNQITCSRCKIFSSAKYMYGTVFQDT